MREVGEPQVTFNYVKTFADYINNFSFSKGVGFTSPKETEAIVPQALQQVWEVDNNKPAVLWEMGNQGGVSGDCFVKVAWDPPYVDAIGRNHAGRVRILPLNSSFCFPEFHPHDRSRLIRFKLKYRFWGTSLEGTRQVFTYVELITEDAIEEYINDELIDSRPNPLGTIPVVHIANLPVSGSPWGLSDIEGVIPLNREFNEKATDISDIINYHAAPVTIVSGAKAGQLEKGPRKVWGGIPADAKVYNLQGIEDLSGPMAYLELLKRAMHEITGVPEGALGQVQPISNTSGVALAITYQPLMNRFGLKKIQYGTGIKSINELVLLTLAVFNPERLVFNPTMDIPLKTGQVGVLDLNDPISYQSDVTWADPLPLDKLIKLNEIMMEIQMGFQSKRGGFKELGYEFPDEKLWEIFQEQIDDTKMQGALDYMKAQIAAAVMAETGMVPGEGGPEAQPPAGTVSNTGKSGDSSVTNSGPPPVDLGLTTNQKQLMSEIVTMAYGTKIPQRRNPNNDDE